MCIQYFTMGFLPEEASAWAISASWWGEYQIPSPSVDVVLGAEVGLGDGRVLYVNPAFPSPRASPLGHTSSLFFHREEVGGSFSVGSGSILCLVRLSGSDEALQTPGIRYIEIDSSLRLVSVALLYEPLYLIDDLGYVIGSPGIQTDAFHSQGAHVLQVLPSNLLASSAVVIPAPLPVL